MVFRKCPGQDLSRKKIEDVIREIPCPFCGEEVEFFFDDKSRTCPRCGTIVSKSDIRILQDLGCAEWCASAEKCIGARLYEKITAARKGKSGK